MSKSLVFKKWAASPAHQLLLSRFLSGDSPPAYRNADFWEPVLMESPSVAIDQFIRYEMIEPASLDEHVTYKFKVSDLKTMLKERKLKISGKKDELVKRLIENDERSMLKATEELNIFHCTREGTAMAEAFLKEEQVKKCSATEKTKTLLSEKKFSDATKVLIQYEASQVFQRGFGIDWKTYNGMHEVKDLKLIFSTTPAIIKGLVIDKLNQLRVAASMMLLWGNNTVRDWLPENFETGINLSPDATCRMLVFHARNKRRIEEYRKNGVISVEIVGANDDKSCQECKKLDGKVFNIERMIQIPHKKCTCEMGCRCRIVASEFSKLY